MLVNLFKKFELKKALTHFTINITIKKLQVQIKVVYVFFHKLYYLKEFEASFSIQN